MHKNKLLANNYNRRIRDNRYHFRRALYHFGTLLILFDPKQIRCSHSYTPNYFHSMIKILLQGKIKTRYIEIGGQWPFLHVDVYDRFSHVDHR